MQKFNDVNQDDSDRDQDRQDEEEVKESAERARSAEMSTPAQEYDDSAALVDKNAYEISAKDLKGRE